MSDIYFPLYNFLSSIKPSHSISPTLTGKLAVFGQETPHQQPSNEAKNCPKQHEQAYTHQEAGSPTRLAQVLRHHHLVTSQCHLSDGPSLVSVSLCVPHGVWLATGQCLWVLGSSYPGLWRVLTLNTAWSSGIRGHKRLY